MNPHRPKEFIDQGFLNYEIKVQNQKIMQKTVLSKVLQANWLLVNLMILLDWKLIRLYKKIVIWEAKNSKTG
jgi:hypothetical protein